MYSFNFTWKNGEFFLEPHFSVALERMQYILIVKWGAFLLIVLGREGLAWSAKLPVYFWLH